MFELLILFVMVICAFTSYRIGYIEGTRKGIDAGIEGCWTRLRKKGLIPANISQERFVAKLTE
ncbi:MAG: hypothetical protein CBE14_001970 [Rickettsiales bacterium TMED254]|nr:MAG: hypothetical protein CBE14_001970 [Rickettsiales bacterium TMED254]|tara:strand:- start:2246 stop:2434 length:189 start_codon:yes stop_codon:yes gene_type:complete